MALHTYHVTFLQYPTLPANFVKSYQVLFYRNHWQVEYSEFNALMGFTSKKLPYNILKMFVKKALSKIKLFLANWHSKVKITLLCTP